MARRARNGRSRVARFVHRGCCRDLSAGQYTRSRCVRLDLVPADVERELRTLVRSSSCPQDFVDFSACACRLSLQVFRKSWRAASPLSRSMSSRSRRNTGARNQPSSVQSYVELHLGDGLRTRPGWSGHWTEASQLKGHESRASGSGGLRRWFS